MNRKQSSSDITTAAHTQGLYLMWRKGFQTVQKTDIKPLAKHYFSPQQQPEAQGQGRSQAGTPGDDVLTRWEPSPELPADPSQTTAAPPLLFETHDLCHSGQSARYFLPVAL
jgi:hypothetical protein